MWALFLVGKLRAAGAWLVEHPLVLTVLGLLVVCGFLWWKNNHLAAALRESRAETALAIANTKKLQTALSEQNLGVENLLRQGEDNVRQAAENARKAAQASQKVRVIYRTKMERIQQATVPAECASAANWAAVETQRLITGWQK